MLKVRELRVAYGGIAAVKGVDLDLTARLYWHQIDAVDRDL